MPTPRLLQAVKRRTLPMEALIGQALVTDRCPQQVLGMLDELADLLLP